GSAADDPLGVPEDALAHVRCGGDLAAHRHSVRHRERAQAALDLGSARDAGLGAWAWHLVLPWFTLALLYAGWYARLTRSQMLDVMRLDYVRTAWAKGLAPRDVIGRHVLRN